jgi:hypothetical protein
MLIGRLRATGKNNALRRKLLEVFLTNFIIPDLTIHAGFAHPSSDKLGVLRTEIENQYSLTVNVWAIHNGRKIL